MLKFYYTPVSVNARRVWVALLEKQIPFEPVLLNLDGDQKAAEFTAINPFQRVPVVIDDDLDLRIVESLAILDYLEAKYPTPALMPTDAAKIAIVRMVEMVAVNELQPAAVPLLKPLVGLDADATQLDTARQHITTVLQFFTQLLEDKPYFAGDAFTLADIVAGTLVLPLPMFGIALDAYPQLLAWAENLNQRESFQHTAPSPEQIEAALPNIKSILQGRSA